MAESFMSNAMLSASICGIFSDARRLRERFVSIASQVETDLDARLADETSARQLYAAMATIREIARSGEQRIARAHSSLFRAADPALRRGFQAAYEEGAKGAKFAEDRPPPIVNGRPSCCEDAKSGEIICVEFVGLGRWAMRVGTLRARSERLQFCPFCGARLPEVAP